MHWTTPSVPAALIAATATGVFPASSVSMSLRISIASAQASFAMLRTICAVMRQPSLPSPTLGERRHSLAPLALEGDVPGLDRRRYIAGKMRVFHDFMGGLLSSPK